MFQKLNNTITYIPILLVWEYLFLFLISTTDWYADNQQILDDIDNYVVGFSIVHFLSFIEIYSKKKVRYFFCLFLIVQLQLVYYYISESTYYFIYLLIIAYPIVRTFI